MFEKLLAALIILALLVLVMFIALPYKPGSDSASAPQTPPVEIAKPKPVAPPPTKITKIEPEPSPPQAPAPKALKKPVEKPAPKAAEKPTEKPAPKVAEKPPAEKPMAEAQPAPVPNPSGNAGVSDVSKSAEPTQTGDQEMVGADAPPRHKVVKYYLDRLPVSPDAEPRPKPTATARSDRPVVEEKLQPEVNAAKADRLRIASAPRMRRSPQHLIVRDDGDSDDDIGDYIRHSSTVSPGWQRTPDEDCPDGRCNCYCAHPYWASSGSDLLGLKRLPERRLAAR